MKDFESGMGGLLYCDKKRWSKMSFSSYSKFKVEESQCVYHKLFYGVDVGTDVCIEYIVLVFYPESYMAGVG